MNNQRRKEKLMTYDEWQSVFEEQVKMYVGRKLHSLMYGTALFLLLVVPPMLMILHYIMRGY
ncbi:MULTISPECIES: hypothetical protein [Blautia]|uniref:hypothetical protein n=1 Tax=Blautia TaxID=572511 RepID=UPI0018AA3531|nr:MULTISPECIES: hypothetical protein [Blautia]MDB6459400.1 hypothetical protein [Blautia wexlerae]MDB6462602.1 hypothetical protein [Blautia wexlerae]MDB6466097.1 hypothetical protein [Blautia wexlerae]